LAKEDGKEQEVQDSCSVGINLFRVLITYLKPVLPEMAIASEAFLNAGELGWKELESPLTGTTINKFKPLMQRVTESDTEALLETSLEMSKESLT